jgi:hypothetical protein
MESQNSINPEPGVQGRRICGARETLACRDTAPLGRDMVAWMAHHCRDGVAFPSPSGYRASLPRRSSGKNMDGTFILLNLPFRVSCLMRIT